jgi:hypothetical protein
MDPITLILTALVTGAAAGSKDTLSLAIKDAYQSLKKRLEHKFNEKQEAQIALKQHEQDPETWEKPLRKALTSVQADQDADILDAAQKLLAVSQSAGAASSITVNTSGERSVGVGGPVSNSPIITGDHNTLQHGKYNIDLEQASDLAIGDNASIEGSEDVN